MSVRAKDIGLAQNFVNRDTSMNQEPQENNDIGKLYKEGKEYTYLLTIAGKDSKLPVHIEPPFKNVVSVEVVQARIPFTEYTIERDRNTVNYSVTRAGTTTDGSILLAERDYTNDELMEEFNARAKLLSSPINLIRLGEEEGTGKFFFYTIRYDSSNASGGYQGSETDFNHQDCPIFTIKATTNAYYPLGLSKNLSISDFKAKSEVYRVVVNGVDTTNSNTPENTSNANGGNYKYSVRCPYRYNLVVSDLVVLRCDELDSRLNREQTGAHIMPLAEFFLSSPGMNESTFQKAIPDRPIAPPIPLSHLSLRFTRENSGSDIGQVMDYDFRGIRWFIKIAVKTLEFPSSSALEKSEEERFRNLTEGFKNTRNRKISYGTKNSGDSYVTQGRIPAAANSY
tara:strand:+ start:18067 stop:19257 length:1191 start_codon:yes stop_codon:yes gene_type:complete